MARLTAYNFVTLNGFFKGPGGDLSWHQHGSKEESEYAADSISAGSTLLFGRITYEMMMSYWPTPQAIENDPVVANGMNEAEKIVFSKTLKTAKWNNTTLVKDDMVEALKKMKKQSSKDMTILGSGSIITQCAEHGLIDEYQVMINPVAIGDGTPMFKGISNKLSLKLVSSRIFKSGVVLLNYQPA